MSEVIDAIGRNICSLSFLAMVVFVGLVLVVEAWRK